MSIFVELIKFAKRDNPIIAKRLATAFNRYLSDDEIRLLAHELSPESIDIDIKELESLVDPDLVEPVKEIEEVEIEI